MLKHKKIILGITGSIAAYKAAFLIRLLVKEGAEVRVVASKDALKFIPSLSLATLSKNPVWSTFESDSNSGNWNNHVELGLWGDAMLIAPCTATTLSKLVNGLADNILTTVYLSAKCPVLVAPAMDLDMYKHFTTQNNLRTAIAKGITVFASNSV